MKKFYITTPIYYVNDKPHIGHAYTTIAADVLARWERIKGSEVFFLTGTDEHGVKIQEIAEGAKRKPQEFVDEISAKFQLAWDVLNISHNNFIRTTSASHIQAVTEALKKLYKDKYIYKGHYEALYCVGCEQYKTKADLVDGKCPDHKREPEVQREEAYLFKLSSFQAQLLKLIKSDEYQISPSERKNEIISFLEKQKLQDVAISRRKEKVYWGIELPFDKNHTTYVWVDAFLNYLTGLRWDGKIPLSPPLKKGEGKGDLKFWPADVQLMSKDILRVHATIWPALLLALREKLPKHLFIHGYFTINGQKMGKSLGNIIDPVELAQKYSPDVIRYFILREIPFGSDGDFSIKRLEERYNADLANGLGNLVARVLTLAEKNLGNKVPIKGRAAFKVAGVWKKCQKAFNNFQFSEALEAVWEFTSECDKYVEENKPWELAKTNQKKLTEILYNLLEALRQIAWLIQPVMPETADKIFEQLGILDTEKSKTLKKAKDWGGLKAGTEIRKNAALFPRI